MNDATPKKILVAYATNAGSTVEVAQAVAGEIARSGIQADIRSLEQVKTIDGYSGVIVGGPMIMGWHRGARAFLKKHRNTFRQVPLAVFVTAMSLTKTRETNLNCVPVYIDENLPKPPLQEGKLTFRERYARVSNYAGPNLGAVRPAKPVSIAFFGGCLEYGRLKSSWQGLFAMFVIQAPAGDKRNWTAIRAWGADIAAAFEREGFGK